MCAESGKKEILIIYNLLIPAQVDGSPGGN